MQYGNDVTMKVVGRQGQPRVDAVSIDRLQQLANAVRRGRPFVPKGVYRFKSFEEADAWMLRMMARRSNHASQS